MVPVVESQVFLQVALVIGLIGLLGLVLRWTFRRDRPDRPTTRARRRKPRVSPVSPPAATPTTPATPARDDFGLLAVAAEVATAEDAATVRRVLSVAGIRSTSTVTTDGRHKVLVFGDQLIKARRVAGGARGADGNAKDTTGGS